MTTTDRATSPSDLAKRTANIATAVEHAKAAIAAATTDLDQAMTELGWAVRGIVERDIADNNTKRQEATTAEAEAEASALTQSWDRQGILGEIAAERTRQDEKWGDQTGLPDGTGCLVDAPLPSSLYMPLDSARAILSVRAEKGVVTFRDILACEVAEAFAEDDPVQLRAELIQVAAVAVQWVEAIDAREEAGRPIPDERRCPAKVEKWRDNPAYHHLVLQCQLNAGHDGDHRHHGDERNYWPGKGGLTDQYDWVEVDAREEADRG